MSTPVDGFRFTNLGAVTTAAFKLKGGKYAVTTKSTGAGTIDLQALAADDTTFINTITTIAAVTGYVTIDLPPGQYRFAITGFTANFLSVVGVPY